MNTLSPWLLEKKTFENTKRMIRFPTSKDKQYNEEQKKRQKDEKKIKIKELKKRSPQNITQKTTDWATCTPIKLILIFISWVLLIQSGLFGTKIYLLILK